MPNIPKAGIALVVLWASLMAFLAIDVAFGFLLLGCAFIMYFPKKVYYIVTLVVILTSATHLWFTPGVNATINIITLLAGFFFLAFGGSRRE